MTCVRRFLMAQPFYDGAMTRSRYEGSFARVIGDEDLLQPTSTRIRWLLLGLVGALIVGFAIGLAAPRQRPASLED